eukprot:CAMPEP_0115591158 /NCGR_PEP_ID=MMETSP0272-20121206/10133_1 /TAXON_ID=71861 /ORGANISM="Scrippsiella trochoidea, Strain CCMP3099" /LENGTH=119 /DNA_ID=CAMNT_0003026371 /DNA_START=174 /DNA_END=530 /DNA_ORIENTATION=-
MPIPTTATSWINCCKASLLSCSSDVSSFSQSPPKRLDADTNASWPASTKPVNVRVTSTTPITKTLQTSKLHMAPSSRGPGVLFTSIGCCLSTLVALGLGGQQAQGHEDGTTVLLALSPS